MHGILHFIVLSTAATCSAFAAPADISAPPCVNSTRTYKAQFDKLTPDIAVPDGFAGSNWNGFTTINPASYHVKPVSGKIVIQGPTAFNSYISSGITVLKSFNFACTGLIPQPNSPRIPFACDIFVLAARNFPPYDIEKYGPYSYHVNYTLLQEGNDSTMKRVNLNAAGSEIHFVIVSSGSVGALLLLDSLVLEEQC